MFVGTLAMGFLKLQVTNRVAKMLDKAIMAKRGFIRLCYSPAVRLKLCLQFYR